MSFGASAAVVAARQATLVRHAARCHRRRCWAETCATVWPGAKRRVRNGYGRVHRQGQLLRMIRLRMVEVETQNPVKPVDVG